MSRMYPACATCRRELQPKRNGVTVVEITREGPYRIWKADLAHCKQCDAVIIVGYGEKPIAEHFQSGFKEELERLRTKDEWVFEVHCF